MRLINPRPFPAQAIPPEVRSRNVLDGMVAHRLIKGRRISRPQVEQLVVRGIRPDAESNPNEARIAYAWLHRGFQRDIRLDHAILEVGSGQQCETFAVLSFDGDADGFASLVV